MMKLINALGILFSYLFLLLGIFIWDWNTFNLLLAFIIDYCVLLIVFVSVSLMMNDKKIMDTISYTVNGIFLGIVQGAFIFLMAFILDGNAAYERNLENLKFVIPAVALPMLLFQFLRIRRIEKNQKLIDEKMGQLFISAVAFPVVILFGFLVGEITDKNKTAVLVTIVSVRIIMEIWMVFFRKNEVKEK